LSCCDNHFFRVRHTPSTPCPRKSCAIWRNGREVGAKKEKKENNRKNIPVFGGHELQTVKELSEQKENGFDCPRLGSIFFRKVFSTRLINK
jgi:hypothetical protein